MKTKRLSFSLLFFSLLLNAYISAQQIKTYSNDELLQRKEIYFSFQHPGMEKMVELSSYLSIDEQSTKDVVTAYANQKTFAQFCNDNIAYKVLTPPSLRQTAEMYEGGLATFNWDAYPTYESYLQIMQDFASNYPEICSLYEIGQSVEGRSLLAARLYHPNYSGGHPPRMLFTGHIHGDELACYVIQLNLINYLLSNYETDERVQRLLDGVEIWVNPLSNPDGLYAGGNETVVGATRFNANGVDLNRNYADPVYGPHPDGNAWQKETEAFMKLAEDFQFTLSANTHGGAELVNYPWDSKMEFHPDNEWWISLSRAYATAAQENSPVGYFEDLNNGISNGYAWYPTRGCRQDYMNYFAGCRETTIEQSSRKALPAAQLTEYWLYNKEAMLGYMEYCLMGANGIVTDSLSSNPLKAKLFIPFHDKDSSWVYSSSDNGWYHRLLDPGTYKIICSAPGYRSLTKSVTVSEGHFSLLDFRLQKSGLGIASLETDPIIEQIGKLIHIDFPEQAILELYNIQGQMIKQLEHASGDSYYEQNNLDGGIYIIRLKTSSQTYSKKIRLI